MRKRLVVSLLVAAWAVPAASETYGPPFGANSYAASIQDVDSLADADDYVAPLLAGETLTVTVTAGRTSALLPKLSLIAPDGGVAGLAPPLVVEKKQGKVVALNKYL